MSSIPIKKSLIFEKHETIKIKKSHTRKYETFKIGGGGRIRTFEAYAAELQSAPFDHSGTPPIGMLSYSLNGFKIATLFDLASSLFKKKVFFLEK